MRHISSVRLFLSLFPLRWLISSSPKQISV